MSTFSERTQKADELEIPFIKTLNKSCQTHRIAKFGVESTDMSALHRYIRKSYDVSSRFVRHLPDSVIVRINDSGIGPKTALIEFKVQGTLIKSDYFFNRTIKTEYQRRIRPEDPELTEKPQIFEVEKEALDIYKQIAELGVAVIIIGWQKPTGRLIAQYANKIVICHEWIPSREKRESGSGTAIYNTHIDSYEPLDTFLSGEFSMQNHVLNTIMQSIRG